MLFSFRFGKLSNKNNNLSNKPIVSFDTSTLIILDQNGNSVVGANSVVTHDIPDYCIAVGSPAYIIKRYNFTSHQWEKTDKKGNFLKL